MTTQPTTEQLAKLENDASKAAIEWWQSSPLRLNDSRLDAYKAGFLRAKQETEQAMKLAKFGAMVMASNLLMNHDYGTVDRAIEAGLLSDKGNDGLVLRSIEYADGIQESIQELLK